MDKTININIAGTLFQIDEVAFRILRDYLLAINNRFRNVRGGHETIEDIESRIAEIFQSQKGLAGVISKENVDTMISIIGKPEDFDHNESETEPLVYSSQRKRMYRNPDNSIISGVCGGIGAYLNIDPVLFRILFVLFAVFFGVGFFVYIVLWIALPTANTDARKREMYGNTYHSARSQNIHPDGTTSSSTPLYNAGYYNTSGVGNAFNEVFRAISRVCYIILRIFLIFIGIVFVLTGFLTILVFVLVFVFKYPGAFSTDAFGTHLIYFPDFMNYIVNPATTPWIMALTIIAVALPMLALIYWGIKMIIWFKAKDGILSLTGLVLWVLAIAALSIIFFNEGISFAESARSTSTYILPNTPDTLYLITEHKVSDLKFDKEISLPDDDYSVFLVDSTNKLFIKTSLQLNLAEDNLTKIEIKKRSSGRTKADAVRKAESLIYNYRMSNDTLYLDEYFTIPYGSKWTADFLTFNLFLPENTILHFDNSSENMFFGGIFINKVKDNIVIDQKFDYDTDPWELGNKYWILSEDGLRETEKAPSKQK
jgi:phage shock protein PspC (stress-responsive transcriptional regulator)